MHATPMPRSAHPIVRRAERAARAADRRAFTSRHVSASPLPAPPGSLRLERAPLRPPAGLAIDQRSRTPLGALERAHAARRSELIAEHREVRLAADRARREAIEAAPEPHREPSTWPQAVGSVALMLLVVAACALACGWLS